MAVEAKREIWQVQEVAEVADLATSLQVADEWAEAAKGKARVTLQRQAGKVTWEG